MFRELLTALLKDIDGGVSASVMGFDGIAIDSVEGPGASGHEVAAAVELAAVTSQLRRAAEGLGSGDIQEVALETEQRVTLLRPLSDRYLLVMTVARNGGVGRARFRMRMIAPKLVAELG
jgi:predicted regulator of Ras-like GTPase activity (Roadblock/LC7/MglB family)